MNYDHASLWVAVASLFVALASLIVSWVATSIARRSLLEAARVAERDLRDWRQTKWFDLYFMASEVWQSLDRFQAKYRSMNAATAGWQPVMYADFNDLMFSIRKLGAVAFVFPKCAPIEGLRSALDFSNPDEAFSTQRLEKIFDAVEDVRQKALVDASILG